MTICVFGAAKGSPGVTTSVAVLAGSWPAHREPLVVEADGGGGDLAARLRPDEDQGAGIRSEPSMVQLAAAGRSGLSGRTILEHVQRLPGGGEIGALVAPLAPFAASSALSSLLDAGLVGCLRDLPGLDVLVDVGRIDPHSPALDLVREVGAVVVVVRPRITSVIHTRELAASLDQIGVSVSLLIVGDSPYRPEEVSRAVGAFPVVGVLPEDGRGADALDGLGSSPKTWGRSPLVRSAPAVAARIVPAGSSTPVEDESRSMPTPDDGRGVSLIGENR